MDSNLQSPSDNTDTKMGFRKPSNDAVNRKYRRRSPVSGSSSSDGSTKRDRSSSPMISREDPAKVPERHQRRKGDGREMDRDSGRTHYGRSGDSYRKRQSSRNSHGYTRQYDSTRHDKHVNDEDSDYHRSSSRSGRESRGGTHSAHMRHESEHSRSRDYSRDVDIYSRDKYDVTGHQSKDKDNEKSSLECQKYKDSSYRRSGEYRGSGRDSGGHHLKESYKSDAKEPIVKVEKKHDKLKINKEKDRYGRAAGHDLEDKAAGKQDFPAKKSKFFSAEKTIGYDKDADEKQFSSSKEEVEMGAKATVEQTCASNSEIAHDLNAAKVAAMRAAELVNKNLVGVGYLSTDQKKKLLWGNKKSTTKEESGHHWDTALIGDQERQEKFNKLMSLRLPWYIWPIVGCEG